MAGMAMALAFHSPPPSPPEPALPLELAEGTVAPSSRLSGPGGARWYQWGRLGWAKILLVATGVWWGVCMQLLFYQGAGHPLAMLPNFDWYLGMMLVYTTRFDWKRLCSGRPQPQSMETAQVMQRHVVPIAVCDYFGTIGTTVGLELAGSAIFGIIFSSVTVWTALFTCLILKKAQAPIKLLGIATVVLGLALPTLDQDSASSQGRQVFLGIVLTSVGTLFYALEYTLCERAYGLYEKPLDAKQLCFYTGLWGLLFTSAWMLYYVVPRWDELVVQEIAARGGNYTLIATLFALHTLNNGVHNAAWFIVCELEGGVSTGLLMGLKAAALFAASAICFCDADHAEQCMTPLKTAATAIVLFGTGVYYWPGELSCCSLLRSGRPADAAASDGLPAPPPPSGGREGTRSAKVRTTKGRPTKGATDKERFTLLSESSSVDSLLTASLGGGERGPRAAAPPLERIDSGRGADGTSGSGSGGESDGACSDGAADERARAAPAPRAATARAATARAAPSLRANGRDDEELGEDDDL